MTFAIAITSDLFAAAAARFAAETAAAVTEAAARVEAEAKALCPVETGALQASIRTVVISPLEREVRAGDGLPDARAVYCEYGTGARGAESSFPGKPPIQYGSRVGNRAQPYLTPAAEAERPRFHAAVEELLRGAP